jgi:methylated-DNA-protein-cysteine methyltransferase-like protein
VKPGGGTHFYEAVYRLVREIPSGRVMTYGQIATVLGTPRAARAVGYAMLVSPEDVPWQRVINRHGGISVGGDPNRPAIQQAMLEDEGIVFGDDDTCDLSVYRWEPEDPDAWFYDGGNAFPFR